MDAALLLIGWFVYVNYIETKKILEILKWNFLCKKFWSRIWDCGVLILLMLVEKKVPLKKINKIEGQLTYYNVSSITWTWNSIHFGKKNCTMYKTTKWEIHMVHFWNPLLYLTLLCRILVTVTLTVILIESHVFCSQKFCKRRCMKWCFQFWGECFYSLAHCVDLHPIILVSRLLHWCIKPMSVMFAVNMQRRARVSVCSCFLC